MKNRKVSDKELDTIYDCVDDLMKGGCWIYLNTYFEALSVTVEKTPLDVLLAWATASLPAKTKISTRDGFIRKCKEVHPDPELWKGLE